MQHNQQILQGFDSIQEESSQIQTDSHIPENTTESNSQSFQLLVRAYERIRGLQQENELLYRQLNQQKGRNEQMAEMYCQMERLKEQLREKDIRIQNLQKISQKAIMDYVRIERELQFQRNDICRIRKNLSVLPSEVSSPLHPTISNHQERRSPFIQPMSPKNSRSKERKDVIPSKERLFLHLRDQNIQETGCGQFTFDAQKRYHAQTKKILKNCFSTKQMTSLVNKVHSRNQNTQHDQKNKLKEYKNYCSSMEKKYSPGISIKKDKIETVKQQFNFSKNFCNSPKNYLLQLRPTTAMNEKHFNSTLATTCKSGFFKNMNEKW